MEKSLESVDILEKNLSERELRQLNPLILAWVGDAVYSSHIRKYLILKGEIRTVSNLHQASIRFVSAEAQSKIVHILLEEELTEREKEIVKKGRNTNSTAPKHATVHEYRYATGFETLIGWLALSGERARAKELSKRAITIIENGEV